MPVTNSLNLTLNREGANVRLIVKYNAVFSAFERNLAGLGMIFTEAIAAIGVDPPGSTTGTAVADFPRRRIIIPSGGGPISLPRSRELVVPRTQLDEDPSVVGGPDFNPDEIVCRVRIESAGLPPTVTPDAFTNQKVLEGAVINAASVGSASD